jgi:hypothetical protein
MKISILVIGMSLMLLLAACALAESSPTATPVPTATKTKTVEPSFTPEPTLDPTVTLEPTLAPTEPPTATQPPPTEELTPTPGPTISPEKNWLVNGNFANGSFNGWNQENGYWTAPPARLHSPPPCSESGTWYLQMDRDVGPNGWPPPPSEDRAWQDILAPGPHSTVFLHYEEAHHMHSGIIELTIYGRMSGGDWEIVFRQTGAQSEFGTGKCGRVGPPATFDYAIPVEFPYDEYRIEIYGKMVHEEDGVLWGDFRLSGE